MSAAEQLVPAVVILESHGARVEGQRTTWRYVVQVDGRAVGEAEGTGPLGRLRALQAAETWCRVQGYPTPPIEYADGPVRSLRTWRVLFATVGLGETGAALALIEAVSYCGRNGHTIVTPEGGVIEREGEAA
jgi:hypothetical protein